MCRVRCAEYSVLASSPGVRRMSSRREHWAFCLLAVTYEAGVSLWAGFISSGWIAGFWGRSSDVVATGGAGVWVFLLVKCALEVLWRLVVQAAADEVLDGGVCVIARRPGDADLAGADAGDGPVGDARARVVAGGGFGGQGNAVAVGDRGQQG